MSTDVSGIWVSVRGQCVCVCVCMRACVCLSQTIVDLLEVEIHIEAAFRVGCGQYRKRFFHNNYGEAQYG